MKVLAINGSARKDGNTAILINIVFEELRLSRQHAGAAHLPHLMQCTISLCCKICLWSVPLIGQWRIGGCCGMSGKTRKVLKQ